MLANTKRLIMDKYFLKELIEGKKPIWYHADEDQGVGRLKTQSRLQILKIIQTMPFIDSEVVGEAGSTQEVKMDIRPTSCSSGKDSPLVSSRTRSSVKKSVHPSAVAFTEFNEIQVPQISSVEVKDDKSRKSKGIVVQFSGWMATKPMIALLKRCLDDKNWHDRTGKSLVSTDDVEYSPDFDRFMGLSAREIFCERRKFSGYQRD